MSGQHALSRLVSTMSLLPHNDQTRSQTAPLLMEAIVGFFARSDWKEIARERIVDLVVIIVLIIHTTAPVAFLTKIAPGGISPIAGFVWLAGALLGTSLVFLTPVRSFILGMKMLPFVLLSGWVILSISWSISTYDSARGAVFLTASHITAIAMAAHLSWKRLLVLLSIAQGLIVTLSVILAIALPQIGQMQETHPGAWSGLWLEKQFMGLYCCHLIITLVALVACDRRYWPVLILIPVAIAGIIGATGRTAMLMTALSLAAMPLVWIYQQGPIRAALVTVSTVIVAMIVTAAAASGFSAALTLLGRGGNLTGRVDIWREVEVLIAARPMTGYGFQAIWRTKQEMTSPYQWIAQATDFAPANAHSSWLDAQLSLGLPGLVLLIVAVCFTWLVVLARMHKSGAGGLMSVATLVALTSVSFTESTLLNHMDLQWFLMVLVAAKALSGEKNETGKSDSMGRLDPDGYAFAPHAGPRPGSSYRGTW
jgi:exopolysaccharide production protein ExoQ